MSGKQRPRTVVLALDTAPGWETLETALNLAMLMQARIEGLFVEDTDLLRLATLPFAREIVALNAQSRPFGSEALEQALRSQALRMQRQLAHEAEARQLEWGFSVVRDRLLRAAVLADPPIPSHPPAASRSAYPLSQPVGATQSSSMNAMTSLRALAMPRFLPTAGPWFA